MILSNLQNLFTRVNEKARRTKLNLIFKQLIDDIRCSFSGPVLVTPPTLLLSTNKRMGTDYNITCSQVQVAYGNILNLKKQFGILYYIWVKVGFICFIIKQVDCRNWNGENNIYYFILLLFITFINLNVLNSWTTRKAFHSRVQHWVCWQMFQKLQKQSSPSQY